MRWRRPSGFWCPVRVLLDECVSKKLRRELPDHDTRTVAEMGWSGTKNGPLLRRAAQEFDVFVTVDQGIEYQENLTGADLAVVIMVAPSNDIDDLRPLMPRVRDGVEQATCGQVLWVRT